VCKGNFYPASSLEKIQKVTGGQKERVDEEVVNKKAM